ATWKSRGINTVVRVPAPGGNYGNDSIDTWSQAANALGLKMIRGPRPNPRDDDAEANLLAWIGPDEPAARGTSAAQAIGAFADSLHAANPNRPVLTNFVGPFVLGKSDPCNGPGDGSDEACYPDFFAKLDWVSNDIYPVLGRMPLGSVGQTLDKL